MKNGPAVMRWSSTSSIWSQGGEEHKARHASVPGAAVPPEKQARVHDAEISHQERVRRRVKEQRLRAMSPWAHKPRDLYGFPVENAAAYLRWAEEWTLRQQQRQAEWDRALRAGAAGRLEPVPPNARAWVWRQRASGGRVYELLRGREPSAEERREIDKDVGRTFNASDVLQEKLSRVLAAFSCLHERSYTQGMSLVLAGLLAVLDGDEGIAFDLLVVIREHILCGYYCPSMAGVKVDTALLRELLRERLDLEVTEARLLLVWSRWTLPLFLDCLPSEACFCVWDLLLERGAAGLFAVGLALGEHFRELLESEEEDDVAVCVQIDLRMGEMYDTSELLARAAEFLEDGELNSTRLCLLRAVRRGEGNRGPDRFNFPAPEEQAAPLAVSAAAAQRTGASPASGVVSSSPTSIFTSIASFLSRATSPSSLAPLSSSPPSAPSLVVPKRVCAFCNVAAENMNLYKWASLGESVARPICAECFAKLKCTACQKHRPDVVDGLCGNCHHPSRPRSATIGPDDERAIM